MNITDTDKRSLLKEQRGNGGQVDKWWNFTMSRWVVLGYNEKKNVEKED